MPKDIRSFFAPVKSTSSSSSSQSSTQPKQPKKKTVISSDEDDPPSDKKVTKTVNAPSRTSNGSNKRRIVYSDDENKPSKKKPNLSKSTQNKEPPKLKVVKDVSDVFGDGPIKRIEKTATTETENKTLTKEEINDHFMDDLDISAVDINVNDISNVEEKKLNDTVERMDESVIENTPKQNRPKKQNDKKGSSKKSSLDSSVLSDEDRQERKRGGPSNPGSKEVPKSKPNCFNGLTFVLTGVYDSLERDEAAEIIKQYGGRVVTSVSKKTSYIVVGTEAGLAKIAKADELGTKHLSEDELLDLIRVKSGLPSQLDKSENTPQKERDSSVKVGESSKKIKEERKTPKKEERETSKKEARKTPKKEEDKTPKKECVKPR